MPATGQARVDANRRYRARMRGERVELRSKPFSDDEIASLRDAYAAHVGRKRGWLDRLARQLGRPKTNLCRKARDLGLTDRARKYGTKPKQFLLRLAPKHPGGRTLWKDRQHPRGMLGKTHAPEARAAMSRSRTGKPRAPFSQETRDLMSRIMVARLRGNPGSINPGKRGVGGRRSDLGDRYFRSRYEANYARFLTWSKKTWVYEPKTFWFDAIKRGTRSYTPDFWVPSEVAFHEVKGWMDPKSATKLKRMAKFHPGVKVIVVGADWFRAAERQGLCAVIPGWECRHSHVKT